ncbi:hypothetical protein J2S98_004214 [Arthrobacter oryzae]|uniref:hypothetical protein n=1 Tax=Arthrobacter oryzae TaxID=409290 RepID=UPI00278B20ED|nr:hypothetical protein [Arthrobacter oryzae]MDP9989025.1 hypothetical protein [Arthrobacter oryzae]
MPTVWTSEGYVSLTTTPPPSPETNGLRPGLTQNMVTPGLLGFVMTAFMVIAVVTLMVSMTRRIRRLRYSEQLREDTTTQPGQGTHRLRIADS